MFQFKVENIARHINPLNFNTIEIPEIINASFGKVTILSGNHEKIIDSIIKTGDLLTLSSNLLNKIYDEIVNCDMTILINNDDLTPIELLAIADEIVLNSIWNPYFPENFDFSNSIYHFFDATDINIGINDCLKIPVKFHDSTALIQTQNLENVLCNHFFVKVVSILPVIDGRTIFSFNREKSKLIYNSQRSICEKVFDIDADFDEYSDEFLCFADKVWMALRIRDSHGSALSSLSCPLVHIRGPPLSGKSRLVDQLCRAVGYHRITVRLSDVHSQSASAMEKKLDRYVAQLKSGNYLALYFRNFDKVFLDLESAATSSKFNSHSVRIFVKMLDEIAALSVAGKQCLLFLSTNDEVPREIYQCTLVHHAVAFLGYRDRVRIIGAFIGGEGNREEVLRKEIVKLSDRIVVGELIPLLQSIASAQRTAPSTIVDLFKRTAAARGTGETAPALDMVSWRDIGGQKKVIDEILAIVLLTTAQHRPVAGFRPRKSGILLHGDPGTGKTLIAKAVASECSLNFVSVKGPELINMYVGQTEENVRSLFRKVCEMVPCLLFCDEMDSLIPRRGFSGDSGGVMDRVVSQFAVELDTVNNADDARVVVMGATNRLDLIDPALLRNGRFDRIFHIAGVIDKSGQLEILKSQTYKLNLDSDVDLDEVVQRFPDRMITGASIYGLVSSAVMNAIRRTIELIENNQREQDCDLVVCMEDFVYGVNNSSWGT